MGAASNDGDEMLPPIPSAGGKGDEGLKARLKKDNERKDHCIGYCGVDVGTNLCTMEFVSSRRGGE